VIAYVNSAVVWNTSDQRSTADHFLVVTASTPIRTSFTSTTRAPTTLTSSVHSHLRDSLENLREFDHLHRPPS